VLATVFLGFAGERWDYEPKHDGIGTDGTGWIRCEFPTPFGTKDF
jgi:hypothetical protein